MEVITIDGRQFVKASAAARQAGYTSDYVGQLARANAIPAKLIGRTWYVDAEALRTHRVEKKRFAREKAREQVKKAIEEKKALESSPRTLERSRMGSRQRAVYDSDEGDLIPKIEKTAHIPDVEAVVIPQKEKEDEQKTEFTPLTVTVVESKNLKKEPVLKRVMKKDGEVHFHRQVIAPRKTRQIVSTPAEKAKVPAKTVVSVKNQLPKEEKEVKSSIPASKRRLPVGFLVIFLVAIPVSFILATLEVHTILRTAANQQVIKTEYVINVGVLLSKIGL